MASVLIPVTNKSGEKPLDFLTRNGFTVICYPDLRIARKYEKSADGKPGKCTEDWSAYTMRQLAVAIGWYP